MEMLHNKSSIDGVIQQLFLPKKYDYNQFILYNFLEMFDFNHSTHKIQNNKKEKLHTSIFSKRKHSSPSSCIVYMHGYGSNRLQCLNLLRVLNENLSLCCFDFSGSGKSQGKLITYGAKQKEDIGFVLKFLKQKGFKKFILWGRSMGATSSLLYTLKYKPKQVILQVIDSPFYSFQEVAKQLVDKHIKIPNFGINFLIDLVKDHCKSFQDNPFTVQLSKIGNSITPTIFLYSQKDDIISFKNSQKICSLYKAQFQKLLIQQNHNSVRTVDTLQKIMKTIHRYLKKSEKQIIKISDLSRNTSEKSFKKGINRATSGCEQNKKMIHSDYGIWMSSKSFIPKKHNQKKNSLYQERQITYTPNLHLMSCDQQSCKSRQNQAKHKFKNNYDDYHSNYFAHQESNNSKKRSFMYRSMDNKSFSSAKTNSSIRSSMMLSYKNYL